MARFRSRGKVSGRSVEGARRSRWATEDRRRQYTAFDAVAVRRFVHDLEIEK